MHPVPREQLAGGRLGLRALTLVVREDEVGAAPVQIDGGVQLAHGQRRAFDVPARPARPPQRAPLGLIGRGRLPEHEVQRIALGGIVGIAATLGGEDEHVGPVQLAQLAEAGVAGDLEVDRAAGHVGVAPVEHHADEAADVGDRRRGAGLAPALQHAERRHVRIEPCHLRGRQVEVVHAQRSGLAQDVVVHVGDVAHAAGLVAPVTQPPLQHVVGQVGGGVTQVGGVIGRDPARVHRDDRPHLEGHDLAGDRVVELHWLHSAPCRRRDGHSSFRPVKRSATRVL